MRKWHVYSVFGVDILRYGMSLVHEADFAVQFLGVKPGVHNKLRMEVGIEVAI